MHQKETERLDIMHKLTEVSLGGKLNLAPIPKNAKRILDIGTGTGIWAMEYGMVHASATGSNMALIHCEPSGDRYPKAEASTPYCQHGHGIEKPRF